MATDVTDRPAGRAAPATRLRVLHVVTTSQRRGAELVALELADELDRLGHRNRVVALGLAFDGRREPGLEPLRTSRRQRPSDLLAGAWRLRRLLAEQPADVVLAHGGWAAQVAALAVRSRGPLLVWQRVLGLPDKVWRPVRRRWLTAVAHRFDAAVALTADQADELRRLGYRGPVWVIPNFRKADRFRDLDGNVAGTRLRVEVGVPEGTPLLGFVGHLVPQKRPERALEVLARLRSHGCAAHLVIAGTGPLQTDLERQARHLGLDGTVTFLGQRDDVERVLAGVDLAVLTSQAEGIPGVAIEALMAGCPVVSVPVGGVAEVIENGVTGVVLGSFDSAEMADAVEGLLADEQARAAMAGAARERTERFSASAAASVYAERLTAALAER